jgi:DNA-binding ferritin-like protein (Dps family)
VGLATDWNHHPTAQKLAVANLIGSWNENNEADIKVVTQIVGDDYTNWIADLLGNILIEL